MLVMFIIFGLILSVSLGAFVAMILTSGIKKTTPRVIVSIIIALVVGFGVSGLMQLQHNVEEKLWNNGICSDCGTPYEIFDIEHHRNSGDTYYYKCENNHLLKTENYFK